MAQLTFTTVVVDPSILRREDLVRVLSAAGFNVAVAAASIAEVVHGPLARSQSILLVLQASGDHNAMVTQIQLFREQHPAARIALLKENGQEHGQLSNADIFAAFRAGVDAYFAEPSRSTFIKSLELVMQGDEMAAGAPFRLSKKLGPIVPVQSETKGVPAPSNPSELAKRAAEAMNDDLTRKAFANKGYAQIMRTSAGKTDRQGATKTNHERDDKG
jgi:DNA-binding NarL/FixJ family response regulator